MPTFDPQSQVTTLQELKAGGMDLNKIIAHVVGNSESLEPLRQKTGQLQIDIENEGKNIIAAMAAKQTAEAALASVENASKLTQEKLVLERQRQIGVDINNPGNDRIAKLSSWMEEESNTHRASIEKIQQLDSVNFVDNPIQYIINQYKIASEKDTAETALKARQAYGAEMTQLHQLAQENVQTLVQSKLAKTDAELQATLDSHAAAAAELAAKQRTANAGQNINAIQAIYGMTADQHSVWFKAAQLKKDAEDRNQDFKMNELRYKMALAQYDAMMTETQSKKDIEAFARNFAVEKLGADPKIVAGVPSDVLLNNTAIKDTMLGSAFGITGVNGPYTALNAMEAVGNPKNFLLNTPAARWVREQATNIPLPPELLKRPKEEQYKYYNEMLRNAAEAELAGDVDNSKLYRIPTVGELKYLAGPDSKALTNNALMKIIAGAPDTTRYSMKQLIGFTLKDPKYKTDGNARAKLINDVVKFAQVAVNYNMGTNFGEKFGLPDQHLSKHGYKIMPKELLEAHNNNLPDNLKLRHFDMTKISDVQALITLALGSSSDATVNLFNTQRFGSELRSEDPISVESRTGKKPIKGKKD
jgi:hypothetical protein